MKNNLYAVILAGGSGTRFWPLSRRANPKQFLNVTGQGTLLAETLKRIQPLVSGQNIMIVTGALYRKEIARQIIPFGIPKANVLLEPQGKNTAPAILWAATRIHQLNPDAVIAVLPADHLILNPKNFLNVLQQAVKLAQENYLVTLGIVPTRPETGYGYLETVKQGGVLKVKRFTEKPSLLKAKQFIKNKNYFCSKNKNYFWNSGMFIWKTAVILEEFRKYLPEVHQILGKDYRQKSIKKVWASLPSISIDYGILEKAKNVVAVAARDIGWSDLGSWESLMVVLPKDKNGNMIKGDVLERNCKNSLLWGEKRLVAAMGLDNLIVIDTPDALLISRRDLSQDVREIVTLLQRKKRKEV